MNVTPLSTLDWTLLVLFGVCAVLSVGLVLNMVRYERRRKRRGGL